MGSTKVQAAPPRDYAQETRDTLSTQIQLAPQLYASEAQFQPLYNNLQMQMTRDALLGNGSAPGLIDTYGQAIPQLGQISAAANTQQRAADIGDVEALGGRASEAFLNANPYLRSALDRADAMSGNQANPAMDALRQQLMAQGPSAISQQLEQGVLQGLSADGSLTPAEQRAAEQQVRASYAARGMALSPQAISAEVQNRLVNQRQRQMENMSAAMGVNQQLMGERQMGISNLGQMAQLDMSNTAANRGFLAQLVGLRQATSSDPFQAILGRPSMAFQSAQGFGQQGMYGTQMAGPSLFNPESSYANNIYGGNQQAQNAANIASAQAKASMIGGIMGGLGSAAGGLLGNAGLFK
jgi:hypothetical protein